jgi:hypothetical protein
MAVREATDLTSSSFAHSSGREREDDSRRPRSRRGPLTRVIRFPAAVERGHQTLQATHGLYAVKIDAPFLPRLFRQITGNRHISAQETGRDPNPRGVLLRVFPVRVPIHTPLRPRESRNQQRLKDHVEIGAANCFVPIDVNCPILRSWGSERPTYTVQARRKTMGGTQGLRSHQAPTLTTAPARLARATAGESRPAKEQRPLEQRGTVLMQLMQPPLLLPSSASSTKT